MGGPCAGGPLFTSALQFQNSPEPDLEIVMCSGYGKNGALSVLQVRGWWLGVVSPRGPGGETRSFVLAEEHPAPGGDDF